jgi:hypothetical protein
MRIIGAAFESGVTIVAGLAGAVLIIGGILLATSPSGNTVFGVVAFLIGAGLIAFARGD